MNIALIGYHGSGKSVIGRKLADALWREFIDIDARLAQGGALPGGPALASQAQRQSKLLAELAGKDELVIAISAGAMLSDDDVSSFKTKGKIAYLQAPAEVLAQRLAGHTCPITPDQIAQALRERDAQYRTEADITVETAPMDVEAVVRLIVRSLM